MYACAVNMEVVLDLLLVTSSFTPRRHLKPGLRADGGECIFNQLISM